MGMPVSAVASTASPAATIIAPCPHTRTRTSQTPATSPIAAATAFTTG